MLTNGLDIDDVYLATGIHNAPRDGACLLEAVSFFAEEEWTDHPGCVSEVLAAFGRSWNDALPATERQRLKVYIPRLIDTAGDKGADERRAWMAMDWLIRVNAVAWLRSAGMGTHADKLDTLPDPIKEAHLSLVEDELADAAVQLGSIGLLLMSWPAAQAVDASGTWPAAASVGWAPLRNSVAADVADNAWLTVRGVARLSTDVGSTSKDLIESAHNLFSAMIEVS